MTEPTPDDEAVAAPRSRRVFLAGAGAVAAGAVGGAAAAAIVAATSTESAPLVVAGPSTTLVVEDYALGSTDPADWWIAALDAARELTDRPRVVIGTSSTYTFQKVVPLSGLHDVTIAGLGATATVISGASNSGEPLRAAFLFDASCDPCSNITVRDIGFSGSLSNADELAGSSTDDAADKLARGARKFDESGRISAGIVVYGDLTSMYDTSAGFQSFTDLTLSGISCVGTESLPFFISGVRGHVSVTGCRFERCLDVGFLFNESVTFSGNHVRWSADNGVSLSRGNARVVCVGNNIYGSFYNGIWIGGFASIGVSGMSSYYGSEGVTVTGNIIDSSGQNGIWASGGPKKVTIAGNTVTNVFRRRVGRAATDAQRQKIEASTLSGNGILVSRLEAKLADGVDRRAVDVTIVGNSLIDCEAGGVLLAAGCQNVLVSANLISRPGRAEYFDGTVVTGDAGRRNFGISIPGTGEAELSPGVSNVSISENFIVDDRSDRRRISGADVPILAYGVYVNPTVRNCAVGDNVVMGAEMPTVQTSPRQLPSGSDRPDATEAGVGGMFFDTGLGRPIFSDGRRWVTAAGDAV